MRHTFHLYGAVVALTLTTVACADTPNRPSLLRGISLTKLEIVGNDLMESGRTQQLAARGVFSDGTTRDLTRDVTWTLGELGRLAISGTGFVTAGPQRGDYTVIATHGRTAGGTANLQATHVVHVIPVGTYRLSGILTNDGAPFGGVPVELVSQDFSAQTVTTPAGAFVFYGVAGDAEIHIVREGFLREVRRLRVTDHNTHTIDLALTPLLEGAYTLKVSVAAECGAALPAGARERSFPVFITQRGVDLDVQLLRPSIKDRSSFSGVAQPGRVVFSLPPHRDRPFFVLPSLIDLFTETNDHLMFVAMAGSAVVRPTGGSAAGTLDGSVEVWAINRDFWWEGVYDSSRPANCQSTAHQFILSK